MVTQQRSAYLVVSSPAIRRINSEQKNNKEMMKWKISRKITSDSTYRETITEMILFTTYKLLVEEC
jgi:hypothetical protein